MLFKVRLEGTQLFLVRILKILIVKPLMRNCHVMTDRFAQLMMTIYVVGDERHTSLRGRGTRTKQSVTKKFEVLYSKNA